MRQLAQIQNQNQQNTSTNWVAPLRENPMAGPTKTTNPFSYDFGQIPVHANSKAILQAKLTVNTPGDKYEKEADVTADKIMQMTDSMSRQTTAAPPDTIQRKCTSCDGKDETEEEQKNKGGSIHTKIQRKCAKCEEEEKQLQRKPLSTGITPLRQTNAESGAAAVTPSLSNKIEASKGNGKAMDPNTQLFMLNGFGVDFSNIRIHTDTDAVQANRALRARAFTSGNDIFFNEGAYQPESESGKHLLAHELTHVVQQTGGHGKGRHSTQLQCDFLPGVAEAYFGGDLGKAVGRAIENTSAGDLAVAGASVISPALAELVAKKKTIY